MRFHDDSGASMDTYWCFPVSKLSCFILNEKIILFIIDWKIILKDYFIIEW